VSDYLIDLDAGCWVWQRARTTAGYGTLTLAGKTRYAHRVVYEGYVDDIPAGYVLFAENMRRTRRTACKRGHPLTDDNVYVAPDGERQCRECIRARARARVRQLAADLKANRWVRSEQDAREASKLQPPSLPSIPVGKCQCGCGANTAIAKKTITSKGIVKGQPGSKLCVNPDHLDAVTALENTHRSRRNRHEN
jgi:hypothetical protein